MQIFQRSCEKSPSVIGLSALQHLQMNDWLPLCGHYIVYESISQMGLILSPGINGERELRGQPANAGSPGKSGR